MGNQMKSKTLEMISPSTDQQPHYISLYKLSDLAALATKQCSFYVKVGICDYWRGGGGGRGCNFD